MTDTLVLVNPTAGGGRAPKVAAELEAALGRSSLAYDLVSTERPLHATELAAAASRAGYVTILVVGGDGTLCEVANGLMQGAGRRPRLAVMRAGTGNDFARTLRLPRTPAEVAAAVSRGRTRRIDLGHVLDRYFLNIAGVGFDAEVAAYINSTAKQGSPVVQYLRGIVRVLGTYRPAPLSITVDGETKDQRSLLVAVCNAQYYAGGLHMCPGADMTDGLLDVVSVGNIGRAHTLAILPAVFLGWHVYHPVVRRSRVRTLTIDSPQPLTVHADGESIGRVPATFSVAPAALEVVVA